MHASSYELPQVLAEDTEDNMCIVLQALHNNSHALAGPFSLHKISVCQGACLSTLPCPENLTIAPDYCMTKQGPRMKHTATVNTKYWACFASAAHQLMPRELPPLRTAMLEAISVSACA